VSPVVACRDESFVANFADKVLLLVVEGDASFKMAS
jgi:hypothetical protein